MQPTLKTLRADAVVERVRTNSALNPLLWLCAVVDAIVIPPAYFSAGLPQLFFCSLAFLPVAGAIAAYFLWMARDPNRLQSEEYQLERQRLLQGSKENEYLPVAAKSNDHTPVPDDDGKPDAPPGISVPWAERI